MAIVQVRWVQRRGVWRMMGSRGLFGRGGGLEERAGDQNSITWSAYPLTVEEVSWSHACLQWRGSKEGEVKRWSEVQNLAGYQ